MNDIEQLNKQLKETYLAYSMQRQISEFKGGFLARISHEIRTPLSDLISLHQLIINDLCDDPQEERECIKEALNSAKKLLHILDEMIVISKIDSGHIPLSLEVISLKKVLLDLAGLSYLLAANKKINLKITLPDEDVLVETDEQKILHIFLILVEIILGQISAGTLEIILSSHPSLKQAIISFISPEIENIFSEPSDLLKNELNKINLTNDFQVSLGLKFLLVQNFLETMKGSLDLVEEEGVKKLRCLLPLPKN